MRFNLKIAAILLGTLVIEPDAGAFSIPFLHRKKAKEEQTAPEKKKTPYEKFVSKKGTVRTPGFINVYATDKDIWFEIPDSLQGRKLILSTVCTESSDDNIGAGRELSDNGWYIIDRTDSMIQFRRPSAAVVAPSGRLSEALALGHYAPVVFSAPIKYRNADSTACVVKATPLFNLSKKACLDLDNVSLANPFESMDSFTVPDDMVSRKAVEVVGNSIVVTQQANVEYHVSMMGFVGDAQKATLALKTSYTLVDDPEGFVSREYDGAVGTRKVPYVEFKSDGGTRKGNWALRWDLSKTPVKVYVSDDFNDAWFEAISNGIEVWNPAFEAVGIHDAFEVVRYPEKDSTFFAEDPLITKVVACGGDGTSISGRYLSDRSDARILSACITVPGDFVSGVRRKGMEIADVDPRYAVYDLPQDAVLEYATASIRSIFGRLLGFTSNPAAARVYSPSQLSDPAFTAANGIASSAMSGAMFNVYATPGYKENGGVTLIDRIGDYDKYAVRWLYGNEKPSFSDDRSCLYADNSGVTVYDPRALSGILGNDEIAYMKALKGHLAAAAENGAAMLSAENVREDYSTLYMEYVFVDYVNALRTCTRVIGGIQTNDRRSTQPRFVEVAESHQKEVAKYVYDELFDFGWLDGNEKLMELAGTNRTISDFTSRNAIIYLGCAAGLKSLCFSEKIFPKGYNTEKYLLDLSKLVLDPVRNGKPSEDQLKAVSTYISLLISSSTVLTQNYKDALSGHVNHSAIDDDVEAAGRMKISGVPAESQERLELECWIRMKEAEKVFERAGLKYQTSICKAALGN